MKSTLELPDPIFRKAKATAAERGQSLKAFVTEALRDKLMRDSARVSATDPEWMKGFDKPKRLHKETVRVLSVVDQEFEVIRSSRSPPIDSSGAKPYFSISGSRYASSTPSQA
jgi:hypothetical protein